MPSFYLFPNPPMKGFICGGKVYLISFIIFVLISTVLFVTYFMNALKNYYGAVIRGPSTFVWALM